MSEGPRARAQYATTLPETVTLFGGTYRNFRDAAIEDVTIGPRQEVTLRLRPLVWQGARGTYGPALSVRFGGIADFHQIVDRFKMIPSLQSEIGFLGPDQHRPASNPAGLAFRFEAERRDWSFGFCCRNVSITE